jgi:hypothetical protein
VFIVAHTPDATVQTPFRPAPAAAAVASVGLPATRPDGQRPVIGTRRALLQRRPAGVAAAPAVPAASGGSAPTAPDTAAAPTTAVDAAPIAASPLPGAGAPGVMAAAVTDRIPLQAGAARWWRGPAAIGESAGGAAATASRATASFVTRLGSHVPQLLTR